MKKSKYIFITFLILLFWSFSLRAQYKYKIEYALIPDVTTYTGVSSNVYLTDGSGNNRRGLLTIGRTCGAAVGFQGFWSFNDVIEFPIEYSFVARDSQFNALNGNICAPFPPFQSFPTSIGCLSQSQIDNLIPSSENRMFNIFRIEPLNVLNGSNNLLSECEVKEFKISNDDCNFAHYGVEYQVGSSTTWEELLPFDIGYITGNASGRSTTFSFQKSDFPGLDNYENLRIRVRYGVSTYSEIITYSYLPCPPTLNSTQPIDVSCSDNSDGSVKLNFDRVLAPNERFRAFYSIVTPEPNSFTIPEANTPPSVFDADNSYTISDIPAGTYTLTYQTLFDDGMGNMVPSDIQGPVEFIINRPSEVTVALASPASQPDCVSDLGSVILTAAGGQDLETGTYQYSNNGGAWQASPTFDNLTQGSSNVFRSRLMLSGGRFCVSPTPTAAVSINTVTNGISITSASVNTSPSYPGASDGAININTSGGSADRTYQVSGPVTRSVTNNLNAAVVSSLPAGTYSISVTDGNNCTANFTSTVQLTAIPVPTVGTPEITIPISCVGDTNGSIRIPISGGVASYNFDWRLNGTSIETGTTGTSFERSNLVPGDYSLIVSSSGVPLNVGAATDTGSITLSAPTQLTITSAVVNDISCFGGTNGSINVSVNGGSPPYRYRIANTGGFNNLDASGNISITTTGTYPLYIRDANNCQVQYSGTPLTIGQPSAAVSVNEITALHVDNNVNGGTAGILEINVANNTGTQSVVWTRDGAAFTPSAASTNLRLVELNAGSYQVTFTDTNTCTASLAAPIIITEPGPLGITSLVANNPILCNGDLTGSITATITGTPPFNFVWERQNDPTFTAPNNASITGLAEGTYTLRLTDSSAAPEVTDTVIITEPAAALSGTALESDISCAGGNDGSIVYTASGGTTPYEYSIDNGTSYQTSNTFSSLTSANYTVIVRDANGCNFTTAGIVIDEPAPIVMTLDNQTNVSSAGGSDGSLDISIAGGTNPYTIAWSGPGTFSSNLEDIATLEAGIYTLEIRDNNYTTDASGCFYRQTFEITQPGPLAINSIDVIDVDCKGNTNGSITIGATGNAPLVYVWEVNGSVIAGQTSNVLQNIAADVYTLTVSDNSANTPVTQTITVDEPTDVLSATAAVTEITCFGGNDGIIEINAVGGTAPYQYALDGGTFEDGNSFGGLTERNYQATVRDSKGCLFNISGNIFVNAPQQMGLIVNEQKSLTAADANDGVIRITPFGGISPYTYQWTADNGFTSNDEDITDLAGGNYTLVITDSNYAIANGAGCSYTQDFIIAEPGVLVATITQSVTLDCKDDAFAELMVTAQGGVQQTPGQPYTYEWFEIFGGSNSLLGETTNTIGDLSAGEYVVRVTDANGISVDANPFTVTEPELLQITLDNKTDILCLGQATGAINVSVTGGTMPYRHFWNGVASTQDISGIPSGTYTIEVSDDNGCNTFLEITIDEPANPLEISSSLVTDASAYETVDGSIDITMTGGLAPYAFAWTRDSDAANLGTSEDISGLPADSYTVIVTDVNGCSFTETYLVNQPDIVEETITPLTCNGGSDASIALLVNRGNGTFGYTWNNGATTDTITNLPAGTYSVTITGFGSGDLVREYTIEDPEPILVDLGADALLCAEQTLAIDATLSDPTASYTWTSDNGFTATSPIVELSERGTYTLSVVNANGCTATGSINIDTSEERLDAILAVSSQGFTGETFIAVDITYPFPDTVEWIIPDEATILTKDINQVEFTFDQPGEYAIGMFVQRGECSDVIYEKVLVLRKDTSVNEDSKGSGEQLEDFILFPNPTSGEFTANIKLSKRGNISIKIFSFANNRLVTEKQERGSDNYTLDFDISNMPAGVYAVMLETPFGKQLQKIIVK